MILFRSMALALLIGLSGVAVAHGGGPHVMGTLKAVDAKSVVVTDTENKDVTVAVDDNTVIEVDGKRATATDLKLGARVVVHTRKTDAGLVAQTIKSRNGTK